MLTNEEKAMQLAFFVDKMKMIPTEYEEHGYLLTVSKTSVQLNRINGSLKEVYCKDCKHYGHNLLAVEDMCTHPAHSDICPVEGAVENGRCFDYNSECTCPFFEVLDEDPAVEVKINLKTKTVEALKPKDKPNRKPTTPIPIQTTNDPNFGFDPTRTDMHDQKGTNRQYRRRAKEELNTDLRQYTKTLTLWQRIKLIGGF